MLESKLEESYTRIYTELKNLINFNPVFISVDFERANTDVEDEIESSEYYEEEVTDEEAMALINNKED